jgi:catechol 2,3-dioxygenase-like lactoylglutathione lyase family enzyme
MLHHVSIGVADVERAANFYDAVLGALGFKRMAEYLPYAVAYGDTGYSFWVQLPSDRNPARAGNGSHIAFNAKNKRAVQSFHSAALEAGGTDEGAPGPRPEYSPDYYGAFVRDLDGNKIEAVVVMEVLPAAAPAKPKARKKATPKKSAKAKSTVRRKKARPAKRKAKRR